LVEKFSKIIPKFYGILKAERPEADKIFEEMKALLTGLDAHLGQKGQRFLSGAKVVCFKLFIFFNPGGNV